MVRNETDAVGAPFVAQNAPYGLSETGPERAMLHRLERLKLAQVVVVGAAAAFAVAAYNGPTSLAMVQETLLSIWRLHKD